MCILLILPAALVWHLTHLQVMPGQEKGHDFLQAEGQARTLPNEISAYRGTITDRNSVTGGEYSCGHYYRYYPRGLSLAQALDLSAAELNAKLQRYARKQFMYVARQLPPHEASALLEQKIRGVIIEREYQRFTPLARWLRIWWALPILMTKAKRE